MPRVILHPGQTLDELCDSGQRPEARPKTLRPGAQAQRCVDLGQLLRRHPRLAARPPGGSQCLAPTLPPGTIPAHDTLATDTQAARDGSLRLSAGRKQSRGLVTTHFQSVKIPSGNMMSSHAPSYPGRPYLVTLLYETQ